MPHLFDIKSRIYDASIRLRRKSLEHDFNDLYNSWEAPSRWLVTPMAMFVSTKSAIICLLVAFSASVFFVITMPGWNAGSPIEDQARGVAYARILCTTLLMFFAYRRLKAIIPQQELSNAQTTPAFRIKNASIQKKPPSVRSLVGSLVAMSLLCLFALPLFSYKPRESLRWKTACLQNLKQLALAFHAYYQDHQTFPPAYLANSAGVPMHSWRVLILPYLGEEQLYRQYDFSEPWNGPHNRRLAEKIPTVFQCPLAQTKNKSILNQWLQQNSVDHQGSSYVVICGPPTAFLEDRGPADSDFRDGMGETLMIAEMPEPNGNWLKPQDPSIDEFCKLTSKQLSIHSDTFLGAFANGDVDSFPSSMSEEEKRAWFNPADGRPKRAPVGP